MSLTLNAQATFFTVEAVVLALIAIILTVKDYENTRGIWIVILVVVMLGLTYRQWTISNKINELFPETKDS
jgi:hypothetical protein